jgi:hypothetical protein
LESDVCAQLMGVKVLADYLGAGSAPAKNSSHGRDSHDCESPQEALGRIADELTSSHNLWASAGSRSGQWGEAQACRIPPGRVLHVIGNSLMAAQLRELIATGIASGWELHPVVATQTPLRVLAEPLAALSGAERYYNLLRRSGFATAEEVAATPDECLRQIRQVGHQMVAAVRKVIADLGWDSPDMTHPTTGHPVTERRRLIIGRLAVEHRLRYREFADMLARSSMPLAALGKIADSLSAEATPPADPLVCLLLDTVGETDLARYYQRTHARSAHTADEQGPGFP